MMNVWASNQTIGIQSRILKIVYCSGKNDNRNIRIDQDLNTKEGAKIAQRINELNIICDMLRDHKIDFFSGYIRALTDIEMKFLTDQLKILSENKLHFSSQYISIPQQSSHYIMSLAESGG